MNDRTYSNRSREHDDVVLDRQLASLKHYSPAPGFEDRVMSQVFTPAPNWIRGIRRRGRALAGTGRLRWLLGGLAGASVFSMCVVSTLVALNAGAVAASFNSLFAQVGLPAWRALLGMTAHAARDASSVINSVTLSGQVVAAALASLVLIVTFNAWILHRLMQPAEVEKVKFDVSP